MNKEAWPRLADLCQKVAERLEPTSTYVDVEVDVVDGSLEDAVGAVLSVLASEGRLCEPVDA